MNISISKFCLLVLCILSATAENSAPAKFAIWSHGNIPPNSQYKTQSTDIANVIQDFQDSSKHAEVIAFLKSSDGKSILSNPAVAHSIRSAPYSTILPSVYQTKQLEDQQVAAQIQLERSELLKNAEKVSLTDLNALVTRHDILTNGKTDAFVVTMSGHESELGSLSALADLAKSARPVTFIAVDESDSVASFPDTHAQYSRLLTATSNVIDGIYYKPEGAEYAIYYADTYLYITPDIFTGVMTGLFMLFVVLIGLSCMGAIQGSSTFVHKIPPIGKEA